MNIYINKYNKYFQKAKNLTGGLLGGSLNNISYVNKYNNYKINSLVYNENKYNKLVDGMLSNTITKYSSVTNKEETYSNNFSYKLVNYEELIEWLSTNPELKKSIETCIQDLRSNSFTIEQLKREEKEDRDTLYFFIYDKQEMISSSRLIYYSDSFGYINFVYTNPEYRGRKLCQNNIKLLIELTTDKYNIKTYELHVEVNNKSAIKCYENIGFVFIKDAIEEWNIKGVLKKVQKMRLKI